MQKANYIIRYIAQGYNKFMEESIVAVRRQGINSHY